jgi:hypothetical protein
MHRALAIALLTLAVGAAPAAACCRGIRLQAKHPRAHPAPLVIGDSVVMAAARRLARAGFDVNAREGRFMRHGLAILRRRRRHDTRPHTVVIALGTNAPATLKQIRRALILLGPHRKLALVTPLRSYRAIGSGTIYAAKRRWPHRVQVLDWAATASGHASWFWGDGTHLRPAGARAYVHVVERALPRPPKR